MDVKTSILEAGIALLRAQGIAALTQPKVARAAGVKQSHLTYYFPKRIDLLIGIAEHCIEGVLADLSAHLNRSAPTASIAETIAAVAIDGIPPRIILGLVVAADSDPELRPPLHRLIRQVRGRIRGILEQAGIANLDQAALLFHASVIGLAVMNEAQRTEESATELKAGVSGILALLGGEEARPAKESS